MLKKHLLTIVVVLISALMLLCIGFVYYNNEVMKKNRLLQEEAELIKLNTDLIPAWVVNDLDLGIWAYYITEDTSVLHLYYSGISLKSEIFDTLEVKLKEQNADLNPLYHLKASVEEYIDFSTSQKILIEQGNKEEFKKRFLEKRGIKVMKEITQFRNKTFELCENLKSKAQKEYENALQRTYFALIALFVVSMPTLAFTVFYTKKAFSFSEKLRQAERERRKMIEQQKEILELTVQQRTKEIAAQNEELIQQGEQIEIQRDLLYKQNQQLKEAQKEIQAKNEEIASQNQILEEEVVERTQELSKAYEELTEYNRQLEQYSFITAHNLRSPVARVLGLCNLLEMENVTFEEKLNIIKQIAANTQLLDEIVKDINHVFEIKRKSQLMLQVVGLEEIINKIRLLLEKEMEESQTEIITDFQQIEYLHTFVPYAESIFYNLIDNAIKFRHPLRKPLVQIGSEKVNQFTKISIQDNGVGIDLEQYKGKIFQLYKRFHLQVAGKGMGLFLVKTQIERLGGRIEVESVPEQGTKFEVYFPEKNL
ncbi:sensor histidine kinase [Thermoflexibacter ruber]|uniref:histidine kinase n=1 Tax=Thermoflexibacter ruber TaxID=1003 RepID=A0A1I2FDG0_9BACT|nr:HAMP domain-containing sensor histidine kinase [Thermoflexibacter ruber]SFF02788.1 Histidine kinase-, DNA gyrase B-, and HSP90-like ATPase [Thermoflexibacter ruber]